MYTYRWRLPIHADSDCKPRSSSLCHDNCWEYMLRTQGSQYAGLRPCMHMYWWWKTCVLLCHNGWKCVLRNMCFIMSQLLKCVLGNMCISMSQLLKMCAWKHVYSYVPIAENVCLETCVLVCHNCWNVCLETCVLVCHNCWKCVLRNMCISMSQLLKMCA